MAHPTDPVAVVIGGSRGAGREIARNLARCGYAVVVVYLRNQAEAEAAVDEILAAEGTALAVRADVTDELDVERLFDETIAAFGGVDVVVHTATCGIAVVDPQAARRLREGGVILTAADATPGAGDQGMPGRDRSLDAGACRRQQPMEVTVSTTDVSGETASEVAGTGAQPPVEMKLEVIVLPVADVDRAKAFYGSLGWRLDADLATGGDFRVVQVTPPGSPSSVIFGTGVTDAAPGSVDSLVLVVDDVEAARDELIGRGVAVSEVFHDEGGVFHHAGTKGRVPGPDPERRSYGSWASFGDPDGNGWLLQEITTRLPGR